MRCPACRNPALEHDQVCMKCGFSLEALAPSMGIPPVLNAPLADVAAVLSAGDRRGVLRTVHSLHQRFPQVSFAAVLMEVATELPAALQAFWLFNRASLFSAVERGGDNHGVLLLVDTRSARAAAMIGYGLEPFVSEKHLEICLTAASASLSKKRHGAAVEAFVRELERQFTAVLPPLNRTFGYAENDVSWQDATLPTGQAARAARAGAEDSGDLY